MRHLLSWSVLCLSLFVAIGCGSGNHKQYGSVIDLYLVSHDTGQWHTLATVEHNSNISGPTVTSRIVPGTYDVYYCHGCATPGSGGISAETDTSDAFPRGLRVLDTCVAVP
jgi:hypothetical protein